MNDDGICVGVIVGLVAGVVLCGVVVSCSFRTQAIEKGFAEYNQTTGDWQWKGADHE